MDDQERQALARWHNAHRAEERRKDAENLAQYQRDCLASWEGLNWKGGAA